MKRIVASFLIETAADNEHSPDVAGYEHVATACCRLMQPQGISAMVHPQTSLQRVDDRDIQWQTVALVRHVDHA